MDVLKQLLGRLHPLIVHLPIGFIIFGLLLQWYDRKRKEYAKVIPLVYLWGGIAAIFACITGYLQYLGEGYAFETVKWHLWSGIATALFSFLMWGKLTGMKRVGSLSKIPMVALASVFFILISFTGHQGGSITHGDDFLVEPLPNSIKSALGFETFEEKEIVLNEENWEEALIYVDVIKPILNNKCVSCHNPKKKKGELLLHTEEGLLHGGENGEVIVAKNASQSELFMRMSLPMEDDDHMPPEGKTQPTKEEIKLIGAWIDVGIPFEGSIKEAGLDKELFLSFFPKKHDFDYPDIAIKEASRDSISGIEQTAIAPQIARLDLGGTQITDAIFEKLMLLPNLTILKLDNTSISGKNIDVLSSLEHLISINLAASQFEEAHLQKLSSFKNLKKVYLYNTKVKSEGVQTLKDGQIDIDYGNYALPPISTDSIVY